MNFKGKYYLRYKVSGEIKELTVNAELKKYGYPYKRFQPIYYAVVKVNGIEYKDKDFNGYVNALAAAEEVGLEFKEKIKQEYKAKRKRIKVLKEILK